MNFVWCVVPSTIKPCWFLFANRIGLLSCMTGRKYDIEWRSDHMSTGVSWWGWEQLSKLPVETSRAILGWDHNGLSRVTIHAAPISKWSILSGSSMVNAFGRALTAVSSFCNLFWCPFVAIQWREARFINVSFCAGETITVIIIVTIITDHHQPSFSAPGLTNAKVSVGCPPLDSSKSWCFASFCFVGILTTFNFATAVCEQHPTTNYIGHKTKRWQQTTQWCQQQTTAMICRISHPGDAEIPGTLRDISTFQLISI